MEKNPSYIYPKDFFENTKISQGKSTCFVMIPFKDEFNKIYEIIRQIVINELKMECYRADSIYSNKPILTKILEMIQKSEIIIADLTDRNPNVFYELGIAHSRKENIIMITHNPDDVPFDLKHLEYIVYENTLSGGENLRLKLTGAINTLREKGNIEYDDENIEILSLEVIFTENIEQYGAALGDLEFEVIDKAEEYIKNFLNSARVPLSKKHGFENIKFDKDKHCLSFPNGFLVSEYKKVESGYDNPLQSYTSFKIIPSRL